MSTGSQRDKPYFKESDLKFNRLLGVSGQSNIFSENSHVNVQAYLPTDYFSSSNPTDSMEANFNDINEWTW
ncbi:hypothetical protein SOMG_02517 [Schizosaccharomyces osmophilus]|uniref:Uncharacterized protein n=1 Tax=Schizosaccharomyces osmophilus TaxID=2545709 RepID=A0AAF0AWU5_9SCHI|nr:uncharacterized protein SOMG_02517 [Schizosaccharomyces osmophilus]WBW73400.1 hypothetical protein SOMG_02517 [Schizosaccharomyces osmophilus]